MTLFDCYLSHWFQRWEVESTGISERGIHQGLPVVWSRAEFDAFVREFLARVYARVLERKPGATHLLDKQPMYALYVREIERYIPSARFIHIVRDGRDVAASMVAARHSMGFGAATVPEAAAAWKKLVLAARDAAQFGDRYREVRYEDLMDDPARELRATLAFLGLEADPERVTRIATEYRYDAMKADRKTALPGVTAHPAHFRRGQVGGWVEDFGLAQRQQFEQFAGDLLVELGYAQPGWWIRSRRDAVRVAAGRWFATVRNTRRRLFRALTG
jgi:hypothetical protein